MKDVVFYGIIAMVIAVISISINMLGNNVKANAHETEVAVITDAAVESSNDLVDYISENVWVYYVG